VIRVSFVGLIAFGLGACASPPPPINYPQGGSVPPQANVPEGRPAVQGPFQPDLNLFVCQNMRISNRPDTDLNNMILNYAPIVVANGVLLATAPVNDACFSSGFGPRDGRMHDGIDLASNPGGLIYSAAPGRVLEVSDIPGYGLQVIIAHGRGVYTRYAHFKSFDSGITPGTEVGFGVPLGIMGATGNATGIHLHYEILTGNYNTPKKSWGLKPNDPLDFPRWEGLDAGS